MTPHPDEGVLHALLDGEVPSSELAPLTAHLSACAECRARMEEARAFREEAERLVSAIELPPEEVRPGWSRRGRPRRQIRLAPLAFAATLLLAIGVGYASRTIQDAGSAARETADQDPGTSAKPAPALTSPGAEADTAGRTDSAARDAAYPVELAAEPVQPPRIPRAEPAVRAPVASPRGSDTVRVTQRYDAADSASRQADVTPLSVQLRGRSGIRAVAPQAAAAPPPAAPTAVLEGRVLAKSGAAIGNAIVRVEGTALTTTARADGSYRLEGEVPADASIVARAIGYRPERKRISLAEADSGRVDFALEQDAMRLEELVVTGVAERASRGAPAAAFARSAPSYRSIGFPEALRLLGGRIRLVDGLVPERLEAAGDTVRVAYRVGPARETLYLQQFRIGDTVAFVLLSPPGFPADSIARLTARVKP